MLVKGIVRTRRQRLHLISMPVAHQRARSRPHSQRMSSLERSSASSDSLDALMVPSNPAHDIAVI